MEANQLPWVDSNNVLQSSSNNEMIPEKAAYRLGRIKWENIAFIGFQFWFFGMAVDAVSPFISLCIHVSNNWSRQCIKIQQKS